ncbi:conserved exported hypothetical protein [Micromonospora lupini str. Lupac 08]|uniref:Uncharacterized protein n=1 Tax=Micromonospora lupini str. Lupac 08 TaxID=1150864 RepID=I0L1R8_9ACTN|nr:conserved exported hypothetical protein [Micromonospora lupini str. Lupac 08]
MLIGVTSAKGSPGATTLALGLALRWPEPGAVMVEADPAGGDLMARFGRTYHDDGREPGLASMAADARSGAGVRMDPSRWVQPLPPGVDVVLAEPGAAAASLRALAVRGPHMLRVLAAGRPAVVLDVGRWEPTSPVNALLSAVDVLLVVLRPMQDEVRAADVRLNGPTGRPIPSAKGRDLSQGREHVEQLTGLVRDVQLVTVGVDGWPAVEVAGSLGLPLAATVPTDRRGAGILAGRMVPRRGWQSTGWTRLPLLRACRGLARDLDRQTSAEASIAPVTEHAGVSGR